MKKLLKAFSSLNPDKALINGVLANDLAAVKKAFARGASPDARHAYDQKYTGALGSSKRDLMTPVVCLALDHASTDIVAEIISHKPDLAQQRDHFFDRHQNALMYALDKLDEAPVKVQLVLAGTSFKSLGESQWHQVFDHAFARKDDKIVDMLLAHRDGALFRDEMKVWKKSLDDRGVGNHLTARFEDAMGHGQPPAARPSPGNAKP